LPSSSRHTEAIGTPAASTTGSAARQDEPSASRSFRVAASATIGLHNGKPAMNASRRAAPLAGIQWTARPDASAASVATGVSPETPGSTR
jgi:hypothetical protein